MAASDEGRALELNEVSWWSLWAQTTWLNKDTYVIISREFNEDFFNRAGFVGIPRDARGTLEAIERAFEQRGRPPNVFVRQDQNHPRLLRVLADSRYRIADQMAVMEVEAPAFAVNKEVDLEVGVDGRLEEWVDTYLVAFYGERSLSKSVVQVLSRVSRMGEVGLMLARLDDKPVGCLAMFRSDKVCGVYCVGTRPEYRKMNVASTMLDLARRMAANEGRRLILQTILSDSLERFYLRLGFKRLYLKDIFVRDVGETAR